MDLTKEPTSPEYTPPARKYDYGDISLAMRPHWLEPDPNAIQFLTREDMDRIHAAVRKRLRKKRAQRPA